MIYFAVTLPTNRSCAAESARLVVDLMPFVFRRSLDYTLANFTRLECRVDEIYVDSDGGRLWTTTDGQGVPLMLCSGGPGCCDYLGPVAAMVDDLVQVIRFEQRGCGRSAAIPPYDVVTCVQDLDNIRRHYGLDRWLIGGHSWGPDLALAYALQYPNRVLGLIGIAGGRIHNDREWHKVYKQRLAEGGEVQPDYEFPPNMMVNQAVGAAWKQYIQRPTLLREIAQLRIPALFVYGDRDIRPSWPVEQLANLMPKARFHLIEGAAHCIWLSHAAELKASLRAFIRSVV
jgi:proline iminopeptidase